MNFYSRIKCSIIVFLLFLAASFANAETFYPKLPSERAGIVRGTEKYDEWLGGAYPSPGQGYHPRCEDWVYGEEAKAEVRRQVSSKVTPSHKVSYFEKPKPSPDEMYKGIVLMCLSDKRCSRASEKHTEHMIHSYKYDISHTDSLHTMLKEHERGNKLRQSMYEKGIINHYFDKNAHAWRSWSLQEIQSMNAREVDSVLQNMWK